MLICIWKVSLCKLHLPLFLSQITSFFLKTQELLPRSSLQPQGGRFPCDCCGSGHLGSNHYPGSLRGAHFPSPSCLPFSYCSRLSGQFKALPRPALCIYRKSLWIWPRRTLSASRKQSWRWRQALSWSASDQTSSF